MHTRIGARRPPLRAGRRGLAFREASPARLPPAAPAPDNARNALAFLRIGRRAGLPAPLPRKSNAPSRSPPGRGQASAHHLVEFLDGERRRGGKRDAGGLGEGRRDGHGARRVRQLDDEHEIDAAEQRIARLQLAAVLLDQRLGLVRAPRADALDRFRRIFAHHHISGHDGILLLRVNWRDYRPGWMLSANWPMPPAGPNISGSDRPRAGAGFCISTGRRPWPRNREPTPKANSCSSTSSTRTARSAPTGACRRRCSAGWRRTRRRAASSSRRTARSPRNPAAPRWRSRASTAPARRRNSASTLSFFQAEE